MSLKQKRSRLLCFCSYNPYRSVFILITGR